MKSINEGRFIWERSQMFLLEDLRVRSTRSSSIPKDIYSLINHYTDAKEFGKYVKMILEGGTIQDTYGRFTKLINDMRNIKMTMPRMQLNSKFVNNMLPEWSRFITEVKLNRGLKESNFDQLYAYLKQHEYVEDNEDHVVQRNVSSVRNDALMSILDEMHE
ncbi:hypothetical protein Tco_1272965 [Tanacetum coccineum]